MREERLVIGQIGVEHGGLGEPWFEYVSWGIGVARASEPKAHEVDGQGVNAPSVDDLLVKAGAALVELLAEERLDPGGRGEALHAVDAVSEAKRVRGLARLIPLEEARGPDVADVAAVGLRIPERTGSDAALEPPAEDPRELARLESVVLEYRGFAVDRATGYRAVGAHARTHRHQTCQLGVRNAER